MSLRIIEENAPIRQLTDQTKKVHLMNFQNSLMHNLLLVFLVFFLSLNANAQNKDTISSKKIYKKAILPAALLGVGVVIDGSRFEQNLQTDLRNKVGNDFEFKIDNYTQYAPVAELVLADIMGIKAKNHWFDQTKYLLISNLITAGITHGLKNILNKTRPNGSDHSFPSGHTSFAFTNASVLYHEFHQTAPVVAYSGYAFAVTTGSFRMLNNKHWLSDVLVGAGIGIAVTELVYYFEPFKNFNPFKKSENIIFVPAFDEGNVGFYFSYQF